MGLVKAIERPNGIVFNYHRITSLDMYVNGQNTINVSSYLSGDKRQVEVDCLMQLRYGNNNASCDVLIDSSVFLAPYNPSMTIESAYEYLLTLPEFEGAEMEGTEFMLDAEATIPEIQEELQAEQPQEEADTDGR